MRNPTKTREPAAVDPVARSVDEPVDPSTATAAVATRPARRGKGGRPRVERPPRTEGERLFRALPGSQEDVAEALGVSQAAASAWATGARRPQPGTRRTIARVFGIDPHAWDRRPASEGARAPEPSGNASSAPEPEPVSDGDQIDRALELDGVPEAKQGTRSDLGTSGHRVPKSAADEKMMKRLRAINRAPEAESTPDEPDQAQPTADVGTANQAPDAPEPAPRPEPAPPAHKLAGALLARVPAPLVVGAMLRALEGHPVALEAVRAALDTLEGASALLPPAEPRPAPPAAGVRTFAPAPRRRPVDDDDLGPVSDDPYAASLAWGER